jgi:integrase
MPTLRKNPSTGRGIAHHYHCNCGWKKSDAKKAFKAKRGQAAPKSNRRALTVAEERDWLQQVNQEPYYLKNALKFAMRTGLRVHELVKAKWSDIPQNTGVYGPGYAEMKVLGKGQKWRTVPLDRQAQTLLEQLKRMPNNPYLFPGGTAKGHVSAATVEAACRRIADRQPGFDWVTPHVLRHTAATRWVMECKHPDWIMDALGHDSIRTTHAYISTLR